jgi:hypothetical protein
MAMAEHSAAIGGIHLDRLRYSLKPEGRTRKIIPDNRLKVAVAKASPGLKPAKPLRLSG